MKQLTDTTFQKEAAQAGYAMVMFSAPWAGPCNLVRPRFEAVAARFGNQMVFGEFNLDDNPDTPERYGVRGVPTFYLLHNGVPVAVKAGAISEQALVDICEGALA